jgi:hypothetical protein
MITVRVIDSFETLNYNNVWDFEEYYYPHHLINYHYIDIREINKMERLLFISGLKYNIKRYIFNDVEIYMFNMKEFDKYIQILKMLYGKDTKFKYKRDEVINFFEGNK